MACPNCGAPTTPGQGCPYCGAGQKAKPTRQGTWSSTQRSQYSSGGAARRSSRGSRRRKKSSIIPLLIIGVIIFLIVTNKSSSNNGPEGAVKNYFSAIEKSDADKLVSASMPDEEFSYIIKSEKLSKKDYLKYLENTCDEFYDKYEVDKKDTDFTVAKEHKVKKEVIDDMTADYDTKNLDITCKEGVVLKLKLEKSKTVLYAVVYNIDDTWYVKQIEADYEKVKGLIQ